MTRLSLIVSALGIPVLVAFYIILSDIEPYMDEIYHIPQGRAYCDGNIEIWDPKITTFPGIYILSAAIPILLKSFHFQNICMNAYFRGINVILGAIFPFILELCRNKIFPDNDGSIWIPLMIATYPVHFFYNFLFYTDTLSTVSVVAVYSLADCLLTTSRPLGSSIVVLVGASLCILARQTNAVWMLFVVGTVMLSKLERMGDVRDRMESPVDTVLCFCQALLRRLFVLVQCTWPLLLPVGAFAVFVLYNGGIVVGDKDNHKMVLHVAMPLHLMAVICLMLGPVETLRSAWLILSESRPVAAEYGKKDDRSSRTESMSLLVRWGVYGLLTLTCAWILWVGVKSHPFLLADNRHVTFYIWRHVLSHPARRLCLAPGYALCCMVVFFKLSESRGIVWILIFATAVVLTLVPAHLFELRYFTPAAVVAVLNMRQVPAKAGIASVCCNMMINVFLVYIYCEPFTWNDGSVARFML